MAALPGWGIQIPIPMLVLSGFVGLIGELDNLGEGTYGFMQALYYTLLKLPSTMFIVLPMASLIGALLGLGALATNSEIIVMRDGKVVESGPARELLAAPKTAYTRALFAAAFDIEAKNGAIAGQ